MILHVVQPGETIYSIAEIYDASVQRLIEANSLLFPNNLVVGQTIIIEFPEDIYIVKEGDTLAGIARTNRISIMQLLRNNPFLSDRQNIFPGESLVIRYKDKKIKKISTNGFASPFIDRTILKKTLPFLTYLSVYGYHFKPDGNLVDIDDTDIIKVSKDYGTAPLMFLTPLNPQGDSYVDVTTRILYNPDILEVHINSILKLVKSKGYYGINVAFQFIETDNTPIYENFLTRLVNILGQEGYPVFVTLIPSVEYNINEITFQKINYTFIGDFTSNIMVLSYNWGYSYGPPSAVTSVYSMKEFLEYIITLIPRDKIEVGFSVIGYDWNLPYIIGISRANSLSYDSALFLALDNNAVIEFDAISQTPFFRYEDRNSGYPKKKIVWFVDARTVDAMLNFIPQYGLYGVGSWNVMQYFSQLWLIVNMRFEIEKILNNTID